MTKKITNQKLVHFHMQMIIIDVTVTLTVTFGQSFTEYPIHHFLKNLTCFLIFDLRFDLVLRFET